MRDVGMEMGSMGIVVVVGWARFVLFVLFPDSSPSSSFIR